MPVGIPQENLPGTVGPLFSWAKIRAGLLQIFFPRHNVIHAQRKMVIVIYGRNGRDFAADQMQFLVHAEPEPRAGKIKGRARQRFQPQQAAIKRAAPFHVMDVDGDVI